MPASMKTGDSESWIVWAIVETVATCIADMMAAVGVREACRSKRP